jgi:hypothetical protein
VHIGKWSLPAFAPRTQFPKVFIDINSWRAASDTPTPSVIASFTVSSRNSLVYIALGIRFIYASFPKFYEMLASTFLANLTLENATLCLRGTHVDGQSSRGIEF